MIFSYYFDPEKKHRLECSFEVQNYNVRNNASIELVFNAKIAEIIDDYVVKSENRLSTFTFASANDGINIAHDIDFIRVRYAPEKKWVFEVRNNRQVNQSVVIGLITETANKNPLGLDIEHKSSIYDALLKGNNLAQLEQSYVAPVLSQTLLNATFDTAEYPVGFESSSAIYVEDKKYYDLNDFIQTFREPIPAASRFVVNMNLAPQRLSDVVDTIFMLDFPNVGTIYVTDRYLQFKVGDRMQQIPFDEPVDPAKLHDGTFFLDPSKLSIEADGGAMKIRYYGKELQASYDQNNPIPVMVFQSAATSGNDAIDTLVDNISVIYYK